MYFILVLSLLQMQANSWVLVLKNETNVCKLKYFVGPVLLLCCVRVSEQL